MHDLTKKYVVLEHLLLPNRGFRFWSTNSENPTTLIDGIVAYKVILCTDHEEEAISVSQKSNGQAIASFKELSEYYKNNPNKY